MVVLLRGGDEFFRGGKKSEGVGGMGMVIKGKGEGEEGLIVMVTTIFLNGPLFWVRFLGPEKGFNLGFD